mgnify:CR=1 FL=1
MLERVIHSVSATYFIDETAINISASIGVSLCPLDNIELDVLMRHADQAMYRAKQQGKNNFQLFEVEEVD